MFLLFGCKEEQSEQQQSAKQTIETFYRAINQHDYALLKSISTKNLQHLIEVIENLDNGLVKYDTINIVVIDVNGSKAEAIVEAKDSYGNLIGVDWELAFVENKWKMDAFNYSLLLEDFEEDLKTGIYMPKKDPSMIPYATKDTPTKN
jgi:hypothetical protein